MDSSDAVCPKCNVGTMDRGFILDHNNVLGLLANRLPQWVEGEVETGVSGQIKLTGKQTNRIDRAYRCKKCGYLELFSSLDTEWG